MTKQFNPVINFIRHKNVENLKISIKMYCTINIDNENNKDIIIA